jgi:UDP-N-acetylmuramoyl-L-alanyl-D-glutamate--2,6-diaminopimelate ligase
VTFSGLQASAKPVFEAGQKMRGLLSSNAQLTSNSKQIVKGDGFVAYAGQRVDGRSYIQQAFANGAGATAFDADGIQRPSVDNEIGVADLKTLAGVFASGFYDNPSAKMSVIAITGTNGKTSCSQWVAQGLATPSQRAAVVGTLGAGLVDLKGIAELTEFGLTTPDAVMMQRLFAGFHAQSAKYVAIEASSIGIVQSRLSGTHITVAVFTNLSRDHLDFHGTMQAYSDAKSELFAWPSLRYAIVNLNDTASQTMLAKLVQSGTAAKSIGYGVQETGQIFSTEMAVESKLIASDLHFEDAGVTFSLTSNWGNAKVGLHLHGLFNVSNALAVLATWLAVDMPFDEAIQKLQSLHSVPGRLQRVLQGSNLPDVQPLVFVDYAHTPDALEKTLLALRTITTRRQAKLWCVFGAGGDRDKGKRPQMAMAAEQWADAIVVTSDNPRAEDPIGIVRDVTAGFSPKALARVHIENDRKIAIHYAVKMASAQDVVLIAGKGHENYQEVFGVKTPFSDYEVAAEALSAFGARVLQ